MAMGELKVNKLRTFLSLFGITIGIFCIVGVMATINSLNKEINDELSSFGSNSLWIDKFDITQMGPEFPWWKYFKRPNMRYREMEFLKQNLKTAENVALFLGNVVSANYNDATLENTILVGVSEDFGKMQGLKVIQGRYLSESDFNRGTPVCVIGHQNAEDLFGNPEYAVGKTIDVSGKKLVVVGLLEKQGESLLSMGFQFDKYILTSNTFFSTLFDENKVSRNLIMLKPKKSENAEEIKAEARAYMRQVRRLTINDDDNFSIYEVNVFSKFFDPIFSTLNIAGFFITLLSLVVGVFGVMNIMFVTVKERTSQIGLKKAIGAPKKVILTEFLLESAFLCVIGGLVGVFLVWIMTWILSALLPFKIFIAPFMIILALIICIVLGIIAGIIPAMQAAKMDPVVAIRTK
jgi:ABC-type antimicrobial peptide transport system, permease component